MEFAGWSSDVFVFFVFQSLLWAPQVTP